MIDEEIFKNKEVLKKFSEHYMDMDIHNSTALEGNTLTRAEVSVFLEEGITVHGKSFKDHVEVHNYSETLKWLKKNIHNKELELSHMLIKQIHKMVTDGTVFNENGDNFSGKYRDDYVFLRTTAYIPPRYDEIEFLLDEQIEGYYKKLDSGYSVFQAACDFHREFERIHPFFDGNGRTGRILLNLLIIQDGYPYLTIEAGKRAEYFEALEQNRFYEFAKEIMEANYQECMKETHNFV